MLLLALLLEQWGLAPHLPLGPRHHVSTREAKVDAVGSCEVAEELLHGGVAYAGGVVRVGDHVLRPSNPHSTSIHRMLRSLADAGFAGASVPVGIDPDGRERLVFIPGDVAIPLYPAWVQTDAALGSIARLLRQMHDVSTEVPVDPDSTWSVWESMGGQERFDRRRRWWAEARVDFEAALR